MDKALYLFSVDESRTKVVHANWVPPMLKDKGLGAKKWMQSVTAVLGGTVSLFKFCRIGRLKKILFLELGRR